MCFIFLRRKTSCRRSYKPAIKEKNAAPGRTTNKTVSGCICCELFGVTACSPSLPRLENNGKMLETQQLFPDRLMTCASLVWEKRKSCPAFTNIHFLQSGSQEIIFVFTFGFTNIHEVHDHIFWTLWVGGLPSWWATPTRSKTLNFLCKIYI